MCHLGHILGQPTFGTQQTTKSKYRLPYLQVCTSLIIPPITLLIDVHDVCVCARERACVCSVAQLCLCDLPGSSVHGIFQTRILEWIAISAGIGGCCFPVIFKL